MTEYIKECHDVSVTFYDSYLKAEVDVYRYPDDSPENALSPEELREVAEMMQDAADELEELKEEIDD